MEKKLNFTDKALNQINKIATGKDKKYFRITVQGGGCSGFKYIFGFDSKFFLFFRFTFILCATLNE